MEDLQFVKTLTVAIFLKIAWYRTLDVEVIKNGSCANQNAVKETQKYGSQNNYLLGE